MLHSLNNRIVGSPTSLSRITSVLFQRFYTKKVEFPTLNGSFDVSSENFKTCIDKGLQLQNRYYKLLESVYGGGGENARQRHTVRNRKLLVRDRLKKLLDDKSEFLELSPFSGQELEYGTVACAGLLTGIGSVSGQLCVIVANDATVKGGTVFPIGVTKQLRAQEIAEENKLPLVFVIDSGGAFLPLQADIFPETGGKTFYNEAILSSKGIPVICMVAGSCTAGAAYVPTMADEAVIVDKIGTIFLGGPPLVKAATGEIVSAEDLGGAKLHSSISGCTDHFGEDEEQSIEITQQIIASLNQPQNPSPKGPIEPPLYNVDDLVGLSMVGHGELPMYQIISRIVDGSRFQEFKTSYGIELITGFAHVEGYIVGVVANNGPLTSEAALKGAHFVELCCQRKIPIVFLQNTVKQGPLSDGEQMAGMIKDHAKMMHAVACAEVPKFTVIVGGSYGAENYVMCGRSFSPRFLYTWPSAHVAMDTMDNLALQYTLLEKSDEEKNGDLDKLKSKFQSESDVFYGSARLWDDGVILPRDTRKVLGMSLQASQATLSPYQQEYGIIRM